jgi:phosphoglycolate phosphatase
MFDNLIHASLLQLSIFFLVFHSIICPYLDVLGRYARTCISENPGCLFIATNPDSTGHMASAQECPGLSLRNLSIFWTISLVSVYLQLIVFAGAGTMVAAVSCSVQKEPIVVGKPSSFLMDFLLKRFAKYI